MQMRGAQALDLVDCHLNAEMTAAELHSDGSPTCSLPDPCAHENVYNQNGNL